MGTGVSTFLPWVYLRLLDAFDTAEAMLLVRVLMPLVSITPPPVRCEGRKRVSIVIVISVPSEITAATRSERLVMRRVGAGNFVPNTKTFTVL